MGNISDSLAGTYAIFAMFAVVGVLTIIAIIFYGAWTLFNGKDDD